MDFAGIRIVRMPFLILKSLNTEGLTASGLSKSLWSCMSFDVRISPTISELFQQSVMSTATSAPFANDVFVNVTSLISHPLSGAGDGGRTRGPRLGKPMLYH